MTCEHCGSALPPVALFCGTCGRSVTTAPPPPSASPNPVPSASPPVASAVNAPASPPASPAPVPIVACASCGVVPEPGDRFCGECGTELTAAEGRDPSPSLSLSLNVAPVGDVTPPPVEDATPPPPPNDGTPPPPAVSARAEQIVLQFSTGDSVSVVGSGLLGRNPRPEPDEVVDHIVVITDPTRSVSKTHLAFGRDGDAFWVSDRHSGNGTVLREPGQLPRLCEPGKRYHVARGTRVDMGDQFMIIG